MVRLLFQHLLVSGLRSQTELPKDKVWPAHLCRLPVPCSVSGRSAFLTSGGWRSSVEKAANKYKFHLYCFVNKATH